MNKAKKVLGVLLTVLAPAVSLGESPDDKLWKAICWQESKNDPNARNAKEDAVGILQIRPIMVRDCNRIVGRNRWTLADRYSVQKSREMWETYLNHYGKNASYFTMACLWNGGPTGLEKETARKYGRDVMQIMSRQAKESVKDGKERR